MIWTIGGGGGYIITLGLNLRSRIGSTVLMLIKHFLKLSILYNFMLLSIAEDIVKCEHKGDFSLS